jgi:hypothetical protein
LKILRDKDDEFAVIRQREIDLEMERNHDEEERERDSATKHEREKQNVLDTQIEQMTLAMDLKRVRGVTDTQNLLRVID